MPRAERRRFLITVGTFDGVHRGHQKLLRWVQAEARRLGLRTMALVFAAPPRFHFRPDLAVPLLTDAEHRARLLAAAGVERVVVLRFGARWARMPHTRFFEEHLVRRWRAGGLLVGRDFAFGRGRKGDLAYLRSACRGRGMHLDVIPLVRVRGRKVSSSIIRELLLKGEVEAAARQLGRPHATWGRVVRGLGLGRKLGFPTANLRVQPGIVTPRGVFHARVSGPWREPKAAACNVGFRPTLGGRPRLAVELHIPGFSGSLYGRELRVEFLRRLRPEKRFPSLEALKAQIARDVARVRVRPSR